MGDISLPDLDSNKHVVMAECFGNARAQYGRWESPEWEEEIVDGIKLVNEDDLALFGKGVPLVKVWRWREAIAALVFADSLGETG